MGRIYYLLGKSATGKDTLYKEILKRRPKLRTVTMYTTRPIREGETDGVEYFFTDRAELERQEAAGKVIGYLLFRPFGEGVYEIGWFFNRAFWRQGYAYEACKAVLDDAFDRRNAHKVFAETIDGERSVPLMKKLGMRPEGVQRSQTKDPLGNWADLYLYGILAEDRP